MIKRVATYAGLSLSTILALFIVAGRPASELFGLLQASADQTVESVTDKIPDAIRDRQLNSQLHDARIALIDSQVELTMGERQVDELKKKADELSQQLDGRKRLLAEAFPILERAIEQKLDHVRFANAEHVTTEFEQYIDELMSQQEQQSEELENLEKSLKGLDANRVAGKDVLTERKFALERQENEVKVLMTKRDQARAEAGTLDLIVAATSAQDSQASSVANAVEKLKTDVDKLEARNQARRSLTPSVGSAGLKQLTRDFSRLDQLRRYTDALPQSAASATQDRFPTQAEAQASCPLH